MHKLTQIQIALSATLFLVLFAVVAKRFADGPERAVRGTNLFETLSQGASSTEACASPEPAVKRTAYEAPSD